MRQIVMCAVLAATLAAAGCERGCRVEPTAGSATVRTSTR
jgi:hypothetical protein